MSSDITLLIKARNEASAALQSVKGDLQQLGSAAGGVSQTLQSAGTAVRNVGMGMTAGVTLPLVAVGAAALTSAADFEQALNVMQQVSGATAGEMAALQAQALQLGAETSFSAGEAADAMLELAKAGLTAEEVGAAIAGTMDLAAAGNLNLAQAAEIAANAVNVFGLAAGDTVGVADMLAAAANASSVEVTDLAQGMQMAGAVFAASGQSIDDLTTALALMGNAGIKGSDAGTSLKTMLMRLTAPTKDAAGELANLGVSMYNADGTMRELPAVMADLQQALYGTNAVTTTSSNLTGEQADRMEYLGGTIEKTKRQLADYQSGVAGATLDDDKRAKKLAELNQTLAAAQTEYGQLAGVGSTTATVMRTMTDETRQAALATIFGADAIRAVNVLMAEGPEGWAAMAEAVGAEGAAAEVADARMRGMAGAIEYFKGSVDSFLIGAALPFLDTMGGIVRQVADGITWIGALPAPIRNMALGFAAAAAAIGPLLVVIGMLSSSIGAALPVLGAVGGAIAALISPVGLVLAAVGGLVAAFVTDFMGIRTAATQAFAPLIKGFKEVITLFTSGTIPIGDVFGELGAILFGVNSEMYDTGEALWSVASAFTGSEEMATQFVDTLWVVGDAILQVRDTITRSFNGVTSAFQVFGSSSTWSSLTATVTSSLGAIGTAIAGVFSGKLSLPDLAGKIGQQFNNIAQAVRDAVASADFGDLRASLAGAIGLENIDLGQLRDSLATFVGNIASTITSFDWGGALATAGEWLGGLTSWVVAQITSIDWGTGLATATEWLSGLTTWVVAQVTAIDWGTALATATEWLGGLTLWIANKITAIDWGTALATAGEWLGGLTTWVTSEITTIDWGTALATAGEWTSGLATWVGSKLATVDWKGINAATFGALQTTVVGAITSIDWGGAPAAGGDMASGLRDGTLKALTDGINGVNWQTASFDFSKMVTQIGTDIDAADFSEIGKSAAQKFKAVIAGAVAQEKETPGSLLPAALSPLALMNIPIAAAIAGINWVFTSEQFAGLRTAVVGAVTTIDWGGISESLATLKTKIQDAFFNLGFGFGQEIATFKWPDIPNWWKWPAVPDWWKWPTVPSWWKWPDVPSWWKWPDVPSWWQWPAMPAWFGQWPAAPGWVDRLLTFHWPPINMPGWVGTLLGFLGGGDAPPGNQLGTSYFGGGWSWVGEAGPELVRLPRGAEVVPNRRSEAMATGMGRVAVTIQQMIVRDDKDIYALAYQVADVLARG